MCILKHEGGPREFPKNKAAAKKKKKSQEQTHSPWNEPPNTGPPPPAPQNLRLAKEHRKTDVAPPSGGEKS